MIFEGNTLNVSMLEDGIAELKFDRQQGPVNKFDVLTLSELRQAIDLVADDESIQGMLLTSGKGVFVVGADITEFGRWFAAQSDQLVADLLRIHATFSALEDLPFPTVAVINGFALGGGFEVCLACDCRVMSATTRVGLPEIKLGIFPGWGGTIRLPRLIGADNALEWIGLGQDKRPTEALAQGAVDAVVAPGQLKASAIHLLEQCRLGKLDYESRRRDKKSPLQLTGVERTMVFETAKAYVTAKAGPNYPAPMIALKCMEAHADLDRDAASRIEAEAFAKVAQTDTAHNLVGLFLNDQMLKRDLKQYGHQASKIESAAVLGAGIMGGGIAFQTALKGIAIVMKDIAAAAVESGLGEAKKLLLKRIERGRMQPDQMADVLNRINPTCTYGDVGGAQLVIEAVVENQEVKKEVLAELEGVVSQDVIISSNTSTISISDLASALKIPERFCGLHFFNPVHVMPLVEVIRGTLTSPETIATAVTFAKAIGKNPIVVNDCPGFLVNRILFPYFNAFTALVRDGADYRVIDRLMQQFGWPMGPAYLLDVIGMDTACHAGKVLAAGYPDRMHNDYTTVIDVLHQAGRLGQKSGAGFYRYEPDKHGKPKKKEDEAVQGLIAEVQAGTAEFSEQEIIERMMIPLCLETARCVEERIVDSPVAADMGLIWGIGFPPFRGGALRYVDTLGIAEFCTAADHYRNLGPAYQATDQLRQMAADNKTFFSMEAES